MNDNVFLYLVLYAKLTTYVTSWGPGTLMKLVSFWNVTKATVLSSDDVTLLSCHWT